MGFLIFKNHDVGLKISLALKRDVQISIGKLPLGKHEMFTEISTTTEITLANKTFYLFYTLLHGLNAY